MMGSLSLVILLLGLVALAGWIWTVLSAFKVGGALWEILNIIPVQPLIGVITLLVGKVDRRPVGLTAIGAFGGIMVSKLGR
jgi:hypothetical protein